jgi:superfamily II DNA or RNA helicase
VTRSPEDSSSRRAFVLRPYQREALEAIESAREAGRRRLVVSLPTGSGKTVIFSRLIARFLERTGRQALVLAHREELLAQARDKIARVVGDAFTVGIERGAERAPRDADVVVASIRSLHTERIGSVLGGRDIGLVIYDECHHAVAEDNMRVLRQIGAFEPDWPGLLVGFTATTVRADGEGLDQAFEQIAYSRGLPEMIADDYLAPLRGFRVSTMADLRQVASAGRDFDPEALAEAIDVQERNDLVARAIQELARDRRTLAFCVTVAHATSLARALRAAGVPAGIVHGAMDSEARARTLARFRRGDLQALTNVGVLTEGFDDPGVSCIAMVRPTRSNALYAQCVGRGTRLAPDKDDCLVLDFVDLTDLELVTLPSLAGMPPELDLAGARLDEAADQYRQLRMHFPDFELGDIAAITLDEIKSRAESFDPLTLDVHPEIRAISPNAWSSLGSVGLALHLERRPGDAPDQLVEILVRRSSSRGRARYEVTLDDEEVASFGRIEEAVEAVDFEVAQMGAHAAVSARSDADWRARPVPDALARRLRELRTPRRAESLGDAVRYLVYAERGPGARRSRRAHLRK